MPITGSYYFAKGFSDYINRFVYFSAFHDALVISVQAFAMYSTWEAAVGAECSGASNLGYP